MKQKHIFIAVFIVFLWGFNFVALKITVTSLPPVFAAALRFLILSIPWILAMLLIVSLLGTTTEVLIPALGFFYGKGIVRVARAATHDVIAKDFIVSARARGHSNMSIIWNEIIPNVRDAILVEGAMRWSWMLLGFSSLSFLGFGVSPPTPDWGLMISNARGLMSFAYWSVIAPIVGLSSLIIGINLTADAFAKALGIDRSTKAPV